MGIRGARSLTVTAAQATANSRLLGGPLRLLGWSFTSAQSGQAEFTPGNPPAAQLDTTVYTVAAGQTATLTALTFLFATDATVGNRTCRVEIRDGSGNVVERIAGVTNDPASTGGVISMYIGASGIGGASGSVNAALPQMVMQAGWTVHIVEAGTVGVADQISAIVGTVSVTANAATGTIFDGSQPVGYIGLVTTATDTEIPGTEGVQIETHLSVQVTAGSINGVIWYLLESDMVPSVKPY